MGEPPVDEGSAPPSEEALRTFLIADVRGYTRFTQTHGDEAAAALASTFARLADEVVTAGGGRLVELRGDEALAVFGSPRQALRTAVALQRRVRGAADPGEALPLGVGIGIDTGEAVPVDGGYRGKALNVAARLCSLATGGEVLATETVASLAGAAPGVRLAPRKPVRVKGIEQPVRFVAATPEEGLPPLPALEVRAARSRGQLIVAGTALVIAVVAAAAVVVLGDEGQAARLAANSLGLLDRSGEVRDVLPVGDGPADVVVAAGSVWVANEQDRSLWRVDPETRAVSKLPLDFGPTALAVGDGALWALDPVGRRVARVDPTAERTVQTYPVGNGPSDVAFGGGSVWVTNEIDGSVTRIVASSQRSTTVAVGVRPTAAAYGAGALWVANAGGDNVVRVDGAGAVQSSPVGHEPVDVSVAGGSVWVATAADGTVWQLDAATGAARRTVPIGASPSSLVADGGGVWVASESAGELSYVDRSGDVETYAVGGGPTAVAVEGERIWVTALAPRAAHRGGILRIAGSPPATDPHEPSLLGLKSLLWEGLIGYPARGGPGGLAPVANLATAIPRPTGGGTRYTFTLRPGIRYSDGRELRASDVRSSLERAVRIEQYSPVVESLRGAERCLATPARCELSAAVLTDDGARTVTFVLQQADPDFLYKLAGPWAWIVPRGTPDRLLGTDRVPSTGPYTFARVSPREWALVRNRRFRERSRAQPDGFADRIVLSDHGGGDPVALVRSGEADVGVEPLPTEAAKSLAVRAPALVHLAPLPRVHFVFMNTRRAPFSDVRVRRALTLAFDRNRLVERLGGSLFARATCQMIPPNIVGHRPTCPWTRDPGAGVWTGPDVSRARRLVSAAGARGARVTVWRVDAGPLLPITEELVPTLRRLGFRVRVRDAAKEGYDYFARAAREDVQVGAMSWHVDVPAPSNIVEPLLSCGAPPDLAYAHFCSPAVDRAARRAAALQPTNPKAAADAWAGVDRRIADAAPFAPLAVPTDVHLVSSRVGNFQAHPFSGVLYGQLWVR